jgi:hypothetical protein
MRNSTLTAHFTNTGKFTTLEIENKHGAGDTTLSVNYEPTPNRKLTQNWFTCTRRTIIEEHNNTVVGENLYLTNLKYSTENDETITFECDLYELHPESYKDEVDQIALEAAYDSMWKPKMDDKVYCEKYVQYFPDVDSWGIKLDDVLSMTDSCTKEELYKVKTLGQGLANVYYDEEIIGSIEQYEFGGPTFEGKWAGYWADNPAQGYGQESDRWTYHNFLGDTRKEVAEQMIDMHWADRMKELKVK